MVEKAAMEAWTGEIAFSTPSHLPAKASHITHGHLMLFNNVKSMSFPSSMILFLSLQVEEGVWEGGSAIYTWYTHAQNTAESAHIA